MKNYVIGFLLAFCLIFLLGANYTRYVDGHCQSSLSNDTKTGEIYLAITNTTSGKTVVHQFNQQDFGKAQKITFDAISISTDALTANNRR